MEYSPSRRSFGVVRLEDWNIGMLGKRLHRRHLKDGILEDWNNGRLEEPEKQKGRKMKKYLVFSRLVFSKREKMQSHLTNKLTNTLNTNSLNTFFKCRIFLFFKDF